MPNEFIEKDDGYRQYEMKDGLLAGWNGEYMKDVRRKMIKGEKVSACNKCYLLESQGQQSLRQTMGEGQPEQFKDDLESDGTIKTMPRDIELHFGNVCNLKCRMCSHYFSHMIGKEMLAVQQDDPEFFRWIQEQGGNVNNWSTGDLTEVYDWYKDKAVLENTFEEIHNHVQSIRVIGGEPTIIPEFWQMFEYLKSKNSLKDKFIKITTNGTNTNPKMTEWFSQMKGVTIMISLDGLDLRNRYIRYPSNWQAIMKNIREYKSIAHLHPSVSLFVAPTPQILNVDQLTDFCIFFENEEVTVGINPDVVSPKICDFNYFPMEYKKIVVDKLKINLAKIKNNINRTHIENTIKVLQQDFNEKEIDQNIRNFVKYNDYMDKFRNTDSWRDLLPELAEVIEKRL
jgi:MoaA/NifB/PqqE/SkfB family radical SAM enzyme